MTDRDQAFSNPIATIYQRYLVPLIFESPAADLRARVLRHRPRRILELAAGTGVLSRALASAAAPDTTIVATDLNPAMLVEAARIGTSHPVAWQAADALSLPFDDGAFDVVVCQFGVMFFPDKPRAYAEARRVLRRGGAFLFNTWDDIARNDFADAVTRALAPVFPTDPPRFLARVPYGYHDVAAIAHDLAMAGFTGPPSMTTIADSSQAPSPRDPALAFCQGTPLRHEIEARDASRLEQATAAAAELVAREFGAGPVEGRIHAHVVEIAA